MAGTARYLADAGIPAQRKRAPGGSAAILKALLTAIGLITLWLGLQTI